MARRKNLIQEKPPNLDCKENCPSFDEAIELFLKEQKILNRTKRTIQWHRDNFHVLKKIFSLQNIPLDLKTITTKQLEHNFILYAMEVIGSQPSTVNNRLITLKSFWKFLEKEGCCPNITQDIKKLKEKKKIIITLNADDINAMFKVCNKRTFTGLRDLTIMQTLLDTGIRLKELVALKTEDIYWKDSLIKADGESVK